MRPADAARGDACVLRADGSRAIGMGHVVRCLALADGLRESGVASVFLTRDGDRGVAETIRRRGYAVATLPAGASLDEDAAETAGRLEEYGARLLVLDVGTDAAHAEPEAYAGYVQRVRARAPVLALVDDGDRPPTGADIVINPNHGAAAPAAPGDGAPRRLVGARYALLRPEFRRAAAAPRAVRERADRVLVTLGGGANDEALCRVLGGLARLARRRPLAVTVVLGIEGEPGPGVRKALARVEPRPRVLGLVDDMAGEMLSSDLAVTAGGSTKYETAATGTPSLLLALVPHQAEAAGRFAAAGSARYLGLADAVEEGGVERAVEALLDDAAGRARMSRLGQVLIDGDGVGRVVSVLKELGVAACAHR